MDQISIRATAEDIAKAGLTGSVLENASAMEPRWWRKRRLLALTCLAKGGTIEAACARAKADRTSVEKWLQAVKKIGMAGLEVYDDNSDFYRDQLAARKSDLILEIQSALRDAMDARERVRLQAVHRAVSGEDVEFVAKSLGITARSIIDWQKRMLRCGLEALRARKRLNATERPL